MPDGDSETTAALGSIDDAIPSLAALLAHLTSQVKIEYSNQLAQFDEALDIADRVASLAEAALAKHKQIIRTFIERLSRDYPYLKLGEALALCLRHDSANSMDPGPFSGELASIFMIGANPFRVPVGKAIIPFCVGHLLWESEIGEKYGRNGAAFIQDYVTGNVMLFEAWNKHSFGPLLTPPYYEIQENDVPIAFCRLVDALWKSGNSIKIISRFLGEVLAPLQFARDHAYDVLVVHDPKTYLQEFMQDAYKTAPRYQTHQDPRAPQHRPVFTARVQIPTVGMIEAEGSSIREATVLAAEAAIAALKHSNQLRFKAFDMERIRAVVADEQWREGAGLTDARRQTIRNWRKQTRFGIDVSDAWLFRSFTNKSARLRIPGAVNNGVLAQCGSRLLELVVAAGLPSGIPRPSKILTSHLERKYKICEYEQLLFPRVAHGDSPLHDIVQSIFYSAFLTNEEATLELLQKEVVTAFAQYRSTLEAPDIQDRIRVAVSSSFVSTIPYVTILQELAQAQPERLLPTYEPIRDLKKPHAPSHKCIGRFQKYSAMGEGSTLRTARNRAAYEILRLIASEANE